VYRRHRLDHRPYLSGIRAPGERCDGGDVRRLTQLSR
tara:strand:+ start:109497 stop:109607 length:111 start_codon:yes stop_codon:yes gene_type:complete